MHWTRVFWSGLVLLVGMCPHAPLVAAEKMTSAELVAKHLMAIGTEDARQKDESRVLEGITAVKFVNGGHGVLQGTAKLYSRPDAMRFTSELGALAYPGEDFLKVGEKTSIGLISPGTRSALGNFLFFNSEVLREGLVGGVMSAAWPLAQLEARGAKLTMHGTRNIDGKQVYEVLYVPRNANSDLDILLYFDTQTFQHVRTKYHLKLHGYAGRLGTSDTEANVEERFSDFRQVEGVTIPLRWMIHYEGEQGMLIEYEMVAQKAGHAIPANAFKMP